jgi:hypothetical protein
MTFMTWEFKKIEVGEQGCSIKSHYEIGANHLTIKAVYKVAYKYARRI